MSSQPNHDTKHVISGSGSFLYRRVKRRRRIRWLSFPFLASLAIRLLRRRKLLMLMISFVFTTTLQLRSQFLAKSKAIMNRELALESRSILFRRSLSPQQTQGSVFPGEQSTLNHLRNQGQSQSHYSRRSGQGKRVLHEIVNYSQRTVDDLKILALGFSWDDSTFTTTDLSEEGPWEQSGADFGSSVLAYPTLLSSNNDTRLVTLSSSFVPPLDALLCTQSIVARRGEDLENEITFDAVFLEFDVLTITHYLLAERLRNRFPRALLVLIRMWSPARNLLFNTINKHGETKTIDLLGWNNNSVSLHSNEVGLKVLESGGARRWSFVLPHEDKSLLRYSLQTLSPAVEYTLPGPSREDFNFPLNLNDYLTLFHPLDPTRLTARGHIVVQSGVYKLIQRYLVDLHRNKEHNHNHFLLRQSRDATSSFDHENKVGTWGSGDDCHVWYSSGQYPRWTTAIQGELACSISHSAHKHVLEVRDGDILRVYNPFNVPRMLFLTYLTTCDHYDDRTYPLVRVYINDKAVVVIDPFQEVDCPPDVQHSQKQTSPLALSHVTRTSPIGLIPPGNHSTLLFHPIEETVSKPSQPFRLVGASFFYKDKDSTLFNSPTLPLDHVLEPQPSIVAEEDVASKLSSLISSISYSFGNLH